MKKAFLFGLLFCSAVMYGQSSQVYSYICDYNVNTGTGERKRWHTTLQFFCRFNADKTICYETDEQGKLKSEIYPGDEKKGKVGYGSYNHQGCYEYKYIGTENGVRIYQEYCTYYQQSDYEKDNRGLYIKNAQRLYSNPKSYTTYIYFSTDYSKMNKPGGEKNCVFSYDRIYPDKAGKPTQIW